MLKQQKVSSLAKWELLIDFLKTSKSNLKQTYIYYSTVFSEVINLSSSNQNDYTITMHYPSDEASLIEMRKRMGSAHIKYIQSYIMSLPISDTQKNHLYEDVIKNLRSNEENNK